jgi:hypothetical protein
VIVKRKTEFQNGQPRQQRNLNGVDSVIFYPLSPLPPTSRLPSPHHRLCVVTCVQVHNVYTTQCMYGSSCCLRIESRSDSSGENSPGNCYLTYSYMYFFALLLVSLLRCCSYCRVINTHSIRTSKLRVHYVLESPAITTLPPCPQFPVVRFDPTICTPAQGSSSYYNNNNNNSTNLLSIYLYIYIHTRTCRCIRRHTYIRRKK